MNTVSTSGEVESFWNFSGVLGTKWSRYSYQVTLSTLLNC